MTFEPNQGSAIEERIAVCGQPTVSPTGQDPCHIFMFLTCHPHPVLAHKDAQELAVELS